MTSLCETARTNKMPSEEELAYLGELAVPEFSPFYLPPTMCGTWLDGFSETVDQNQQGG